MRTEVATGWGQQRTKMAGAVLALLSLAEFGLPHGRAQLEYNGAFVQTHREDYDEIPKLGDLRRGARSPANTPPSFFPDRDSYYPSYSSATISVPRSYYKAAGEAERSAFALPGSPFGIYTTAFPWNQVGFKDYNEPPDTLQGPPQKYSLETTSLSQPSPAARPGSAVLIAHLPEHAVFWVEGTRTHSIGRTRFFQSPPLLPNREYSYKIRAAWIENGRWVSQTRKILVRAGLVQAIYLRSQ